METVLRRVATLLPVEVFLAVYLPRIGHGRIALILRILATDSAMLA
jgi:hypothetical protein